jgi:hypothetical protein
MTLGPRTLRKGRGYKKKRSENDFSTSNKLQSKGLKKITYCNKI